MFVAQETKEKSGFEKKYHMPILRQLHLLTFAILALYLVG
jgi:hypothetical protein